MKCTQKARRFRERKVTDCDINERRCLECKTPWINLFAKAITVADIRNVAFRDAATTPAAATLDLAISSLAFRHFLPQRSLWNPELTVQGVVPFAMISYALVDHAGAQTAIATREELAGRI